MLFDTTLAPQTLGNARLQKGGIDLAGLGLSVPEILGALSCAKLPDFGDLYDVHSLLRANTPHQVLARNVTICFLRPGDPDPASATATLLEVRLDVECDESGTVVDGCLNALLYDRANSPWADHEASLACRALTRAAEQKRAGCARPWNVTSLQDELRTEQLRQIGAFFLGVWSWTCRMARSLFHINLWWGIVCFGSVGSSTSELIEFDGDVAALVAPYGTGRRQLHG